VRGAIPACTIDWTRVHALPVAVPPETLGAADRQAYVQSIDAGGDIPLSTHGRFNSARPGFGAARKTASNHILPGDSTAGAPATLPGAASSVVAAGAFSPAPPDPGTRVQVEAQLQRKLPFDSTSSSFSALPMPVRDLDTIRFFFRDQANPAFAGTLGLDQPGVAADDAALPDTLLETRMDGGVRIIGELDRLLLRAPVAGRFRFEPYYVFVQPDATHFNTVGPSNSGRLLVQQPMLGTAERLENTDTQVFKSRVFAFDHVDRESVAQLNNRMLTMLVAFVKPAIQAFNAEAGAEPRLAIPKSSPEVVGWMLDAVAGMLRGWTAFLSVLAWRPEDTAVKAAIPPAWFGAFAATPMHPADAKPITDVIDAIKAHDEWLQSLLFFGENVLAPRLAGFTWSEVITRAGEDPDTRRFPVTKDNPPFTPKNNDLVKQHQRLRLLDDPKLRWLPCFAGCPVGRPSRTFAAAAPPAAARTFPAGAITTYELEVLHAAGEAHTALGLGAQPAAAAAEAGRAMDLAPYSAQAIGHACTFTAQRSPADSLHTTVDWLLELTRGIHVKPLPEDGFIDLLPLLDGAGGAGHPLGDALRADDHERAVSLRRQMDALEPTPLAEDGLTWWDGEVNFTKDLAGNWEHTDPEGKPANSKPAPRTPYLDHRTRQPAPAGNSVPFMDMLLNPSGFGTFDLESAYLARARMSDPYDGPDQLPMSVLLALLEREGTKLFAPINRRVRNVTTAAAAPLIWDAVQMSDLSNWSAAVDERGRMGWMLFPYGLDSFATPRADDDRLGRPVLGTDDTAFNAVVGRVASAGVLDLGNEDAGGYIRTRVSSDWKVLPAPPAPPPPPPNPGTPRIWKRSRRAHWAGIAMMAGFFRRRQRQMHAPTDANGFSEPGWAPAPGWLPAGSSPPDLTGKSPADDEWKDYISYYSLIYLAYNTSPPTWRDLLKGAEVAKPGASPITLRDFLLFQHERHRQAIGNMVHFAIGLDAFMRLDYMTGAGRGAFPAATPDVTPVAGRAWRTVP